MATIVIEDGLLVCPVCGDPGGLHHERVRVWRRAENAGGDVVRMSAAESGGQVEVVPCAADAFPKGSRRHVLEIDFRCEHHPERPVLRITQHKGSTRLDWAPGAHLRSVRPV